VTRPIVTALAVLLLAAACSSSGSEPPPDDGSGFPIQITTPAGTVTVDARPEHIVSLSPTATETLFAIGAGDQVVAVDDQSNYPAEAPVSDLSGLEPNVEAIAALDADLVVMMFDAGGETVAALDAVGIPSIVQPAAIDLDDAYTQIEQLGAATGNVAGAAGVVASMRQDIDRIASSTEAAGTTYYHELDPFLFAATSSSFVGALYGMLGMTNIADAADDGSGYPQLSAEFVVDEDPEFVFLADTKCCDQDAATIVERPGWATLQAVRTGRVVELDDDIASRWGPRVVALLEAIAAAVGTRVGS
jgi:cobalamin transport system substrate-binding protein